MDAFEYWKATYSTVKAKYLLSMGLVLKKQKQAATLSALFFWWSQSHFRNVCAAARKMNLKFPL